MHLRVSPILIGLTPGHLSKAMRRHAVKEEIPWGPTYEVRSLLGTLAMELHRSIDALLKKEQRRFHVVESRSHPSSEQ